MKKMGWANNKAELKAKMKKNLREYDLVASSSDNEENQATLKELIVQYERYANEYERMSGDIDAFEEKMLAEIAERNQKASSTCLASKGKVPA